MLDLDNRLKDVLDALQGLIGDKGKSHALKQVIPNDNQIYRLVCREAIAAEVQTRTPATTAIAEPRRSREKGRTHVSSVL